MKFQNPSLNFFLNGQKDARTHAGTSRNQYAPHFFKVGGIKRANLKFLTTALRGESASQRGTSHIYLKRKSTILEPVLKTRYTMYSLGANHPVRLNSLSALL